MSLDIGPAREEIDAIFNRMREFNNGVNVGAEKPYHGDQLEMSNRMLTTKLKNNSYSGSFQPGIGRYYSEGTIESEDSLWV